MIGSEAFGGLNVSYNIIKLIINKEVPVETNIMLNWIDVKDVAQGCWLAATKGRPGERYILASERGMTIRETTLIAQALFPERMIKLPIIVAKPVLYAVAWFIEMGSKLTGKAPKLTPKDIAMFSGLQQHFDITKARTELGFSPRTATLAVQDAMLYLQENQARLIS